MAFGPRRAAPDNGAPLARTDTMNATLSLSLAALCAASAAASALAQTDPYLWLEDVTGERAMAWVKERNAQTEALLKSRADFPALRAELLEALNASDRIPRLGPAGPDPAPGRLHLHAVAGRQEQARPVAAHQPGRIRQARSAVGAGAGPGRARPARGQELGVQQRQLPGTGLPALPDAALARRFRCHRAARVRHRRQGLRQGRLRAARGQEPGGVARRRSPLRGHRLRTRKPDRLGATRASRACGSAASPWRAPAPCSRVSRRTPGSACRSTAMAGASAPWCNGRWTSTAPSTTGCRPTAACASCRCRWTPKPRLWGERLLVQLRSDWTTGGRTHPAGTLLVGSWSGLWQGRPGFRALFRAERHTLARRLCHDAAPCAAERGRQRRLTPRGMGLLHPQAATPRGQGPLPRQARHPQPARQRPEETTRWPTATWSPTPTS
jgi:hypothetical protein